MAEEADSLQLNGKRTVRLYISLNYYKSGGQFLRQGGHCL